MRRGDGVLDQVTIVGRDLLRPELEGQLVERAGEVLQEEQRHAAAGAEASKRVGLLAGSEELRRCIDVAGGWVRHLASPLGGVQASGSTPFIYDDHHVYPKDVTRAENRKFPVEVLDKPFINILYKNETSNEGHNKRQ